MFIILYYKFWFCYLKCEGMFYRGINGYSIKKRINLYSCERNRNWIIIVLNGIVV